MRYSVRIILDEIEVEAENEEQAKEIAQDIYDSDAYTKLHAGLSIVDCEVDALEQL